MFSVGRICQQGKHPATTHFGKFAIIGGDAIHGSMIEFVITGVDNQAGGRLDPQTNTIRYGMADMEEFHLERTNLYRFTSANVDQFGFLTEVAAVELVSDQAVV